MLDHLTADGDGSTSHGDDVIHLDDVIAACEAARDWDGYEAATQQRKLRRGLVFADLACLMKKHKWYIGVGVGVGVEVGVVVVM